MVLKIKGWKLYILHKTSKIYLKKFKLMRKGLAISETKWYYTTIEKTYAQKVEETAKNMTR